MKITVDSEELSKEAFNQIVRIAQTGEGSEVFKDAEESWVLYVVSLCNDQYNGYPKSNDDFGAEIHELHGILANTEPSLFCDITNADERERIREVLEHLKEKSVVKQFGDRWVLESTEIDV